MRLPLSCSNLQGSNSLLPIASRTTTASCLGRTFGKRLKEGDWHQLYCDPRAERREEELFKDDGTLSYISAAMKRLLIRTIEVYQC